jgi:4-amino-4-deoxy-L-arabinose transferase-like glycosyltransferase
MKGHAPVVMALLALSLTLFFVGTAGTGLRGTDELRYGKIAQELEPGRNLFLLHFNGERYTDKPPLIFWMLRASFLLTDGISPISARLPGSLSSVISTILCYFIAMAVFRDRRLAFLSAFTLMIMPRFLWIGRWVRLDLVMSTFTYGAMLCFAVNYFGERRRLAGWWFWILLAFSFAIKGPAGPVVALGSILTFLFWQKEFGRSKELLHIGGIFAFVALTLAWVLPIALLSNQADSHDLIVEQNIGRIIDPDRHLRPFWYYGEILWYDAFPSMLLIAISGLFAWRLRTGKEPEHAESQWARQRTARRFLLSWAGFTLLMFTLYPPKRGQYLLPGYPAAAMFGVYFVHVLEERLRLGGANASKALRRMLRFPLGLSLFVMAAGFLVLLWLDLLVPIAMKIVGVFSAEAAEDLTIEFAESDFGGTSIGWIVKLLGTGACGALVGFVVTRLKANRGIEAYAGVLATAWLLFASYFAFVVPYSYSDDELKQYASEFAAKLEARPDLRICVYGEDKPFYNIYGDFPVRYFDKEYDREFLAHTESLHEQGHPLLIIYETKREKKVRRASWFEGMTRRESTVDDDEITILETPSVPG